MLTLNDQVGQFILKYKKWHNVTIEQLLDQTSGISDYINTKDWWLKVNAATKAGKVFSLEDLLNVAYEQPNNFPAGTKWEYSNTNYVLLGLILEQVTHKSMKALMADLIKQAGLANTYYLPQIYSAAIMQRISHGYGHYDKIYDVTKVNGSWAHTSGAIVSTPEDLATWMHILFNVSIV